MLLSDRSDKIDRMDYRNWTTSKITRKGYRGRTEILCRCKCGAEKFVRQSDLRSGKSTQCRACSYQESQTHRKLSQERLAIKKCWLDMRRRCQLDKNYAGRGIRVCSAWQTFETFNQWAVRSGFQLGLTIERRNVNGNYSPANCRWVPKAEQASNTRRTKLLKFNGRTLTYSQWERETGIPKGMIRWRILAGWSVEDALSIEPKLGRRYRHEK